MNSENFASSEAGPSKRNTWPRRHGLVLSPRSEIPPFVALVDMGGWPCSLPGQSWGSLPWRILRPGSTGYPSSFPSEGDESLGVSKADRLAWGVFVRVALCLKTTPGLELSTDREEVSLLPRSQFSATWRVSGDPFQGSSSLGVGVGKDLTSVRMASPGGSNIVKQRGQPESTEVLCEGEREWEGAGGGGRCPLANECKEPMGTLGLGIMTTWKTLDMCVNSQYQNASRQKYRCAH